MTRYFCDNCGLEIDSAHYVLVGDGGTRIYCLDCIAGRIPLPAAVAATAPDAKPEPSLPHEWEGPVDDQGSYQCYYCGAMHTANNREEPCPARKAGEG